MMESLTYETNSMKVYISGKFQSNNSNAIASLKVEASSIINSVSLMEIMFTGTNISHMAAYNTNENNLDTDYLQGCVNTDLDYFKFFKIKTYAGNSEKLKF